MMQVCSFVSGISIIYKKGNYVNEWKKFDVPNKL